MRLVASAVQDIGANFVKIGDSSERCIYAHVSYFVLLLVAGLFQPLPSGLRYVEENSGTAHC